MKQYILTKIKIKNIQPEKLTEINLLIGNSTKKTPSNGNFRGLNSERGKRWELPDENNKFVTKQFSAATTDDMKSYIQRTISNNPECIVQHCGTNDLRQNTSAVEIGKKMLELAVSCKSDSNNILISGYCSTST